MSQVILKKASSFVLRRLSLSLSYSHIISALYDAIAIEMLGAYDFPWNLCEIYLCRLFFTSCI